MDILLSERGMAECRQASFKLARYPADVVITSTMKRSIDTAHLLLPDGPALVQNPLCNERNFGVLEGHTWDEINSFEPPILLIKVGRDWHTVNPKGGEPFEDVWQRAKKFRGYLFKNFRGKSILVVSHGVFLQLFHGLLRGLNCIESLAAYPANLELYRFIFSGRNLLKEEVIRLADKSREVKF